MKMKAIRGVDPAVRELIESAVSRGIQQTVITKRTGLGRNSIQRWGRGHNDPGVSALRAALNSIGLDIIVVPKSVAQRVDGTATSMQGLTP